MDKSLDKPRSDSDLIETWLSHMRVNTTRAYSSDIGVLLTGKSLRQIRTSDIERVCAKCSASVYRRRLAAIRSLFHFAMGCGYLKFNPASDFRYVQASPALAFKTLSEATVMAMLEGDDDPTLQCLVGLMYYCAVTADEATEILWSDITRRNGERVLRIRGTYERTATIPEFIWSKLITPVQHKRRKGKPSSNYVFPSYGYINPGGQLETTSLRRRVHAFGEMHKVYLTPLLLRNSHAKHLIERGVSVLQLQASLGHHSSRTTVRRFQDIDNVKSVKLRLPHAKSERL